jgi:hypothetical protein
VLHGSLVAGPAVIKAGVVKVDLLPAHCSVAIEADTPIVVGGSPMTQATGKQAAVRLDRLLPGLSIVAKRTLAAIVIKVYDVAGLAVVSTTVLVDDF